MALKIRTNGVGRMAAAFVAAICLLVAGAAISAIVLWDDPPDLLARPQLSGTVPVTQREYDDAQSVGLAVTMGATQSLMSPAAGVLTGSSCAVSGQAVSGQSLISISGVPIVSLATSVPLWRDIVRGASGADVVAVANALTGMQRFSGDVNAAAGSSLIAAFRQLALDLGTAKADIPEGVIPVSQVAWLPYDGITIGTCDATVGSLVSPGQALIGFQVPITSARVTADLSRFVPGERTLVLDGQHLALNADGTVTDPESLRALAATGIFRVALANGALGSLQARYTLTEPLTVSVVPPAALRPITTGKGCVLGDGQPMAVSIISSELGQSFVTFEATAPTAVELNPPSDLAC